MQFSDLEACVTAVVGGALVQKEHIVRSRFGEVIGKLHGEVFGEVGSLRGTNIPQTRKLWLR